MPDCNKLISKARRSPSSLRFQEARQLAECLGFQFVRSRGSHFYYKAPGVLLPINLQNVEGNAKAYEVRKMIRIHDESAGEGNA